MARKLTAKDKAAMQEARFRTQEERTAAREALASNPQFQNPKFWLGVDTEIVNAVEKAMRAAIRAQKRRRIQELEEELARLKGE